MHQRHKVADTVQSPVPAKKISAAIFNGLSDYGL
jgi:hypothetical protein